MAKEKKAIITSETNADVTKHRKNISEMVTPPNKIKKRERFDYLEVLIVLCFFLLNHIFFVLILFVLLHNHQKLLLIL